MTTIFRTDEIDLAAVLVAETGQQPRIHVDPTRSTFAFEQTAEVNRAALAWAAGNITCNARALLRARRSLFNRIRGGAR